MSMLHRDLEWAKKHKSISRILLDDGEIYVGFIKNFDDEFIEFRYPSHVVNHIENMDDEDTLDRTFTDELIRTDFVLKFSKDCSHELTLANLQYFQNHKKHGLKSWREKELKGRLTPEQKEKLKEEG